jgi:hypothetical protein
MSGDSSNQILAERLRSRVRDSGVLSQDRRLGAFAAGAGHPHSLEEPFGSLAELVGAASYRVTDAHVGAVRVAAGSDKAAFEVVMSASVGAGLARWDAAWAVIEEAFGASD